MARWSSSFVHILRTAGQNLCCQRIEVMAKRGKEIVDFQIEI